MRRDNHSSSIGTSLAITSRHRFVLLQMPVCVSTRVFLPSSSIWALASPRLPLSIFPLASSEHDKGFPQNLSFRPYPLVHPESGLHSQAHFPKAKFISWILSLQGLTFVSQHPVWAGSIFLCIVSTDTLGPISFPTVLFFMRQFSLSLCNHTSPCVFVFFCFYAAASHAPILCLPKFYLSSCF